MSELKHCKCGGAPIVIRHRETKQFTVLCIDCIQLYGMDDENFDMTMVKYFGSAEEAVEAWNRREANG